MKKIIMASVISLAAMLSVTSCEEAVPDPQVVSQTETTVTHSSVSDQIEEPDGSEADKTEVQKTGETEKTEETGTQIAEVSEESVSEENSGQTEAVPQQPDENNQETDQNQAEEVNNYKPVSYEDNIWATFLVNPEVPAYTDSSQGYEILDVLCDDSVIGDVASLSRNAKAPSDTKAYGTDVITAGGPVSYDSLAYGKLSEIPNSFLNAMVQKMRADIGDYYGGHSSGAGMGYRTFYQASYDVNTGNLQVSQSDGYWARTLGAFSEHCAGVAVDFDISYQNSQFLESTGGSNREGGTAANNEFRWLADNAYKYGFIWRYKIDGSDDSANGLKTGTIREGWHWRFVGVYHASKFWEKCALDTDGDGAPDTGYMTNDNYVWEDYFYENISRNSKYPQNEYEAFCSFYNEDKGNKCTYDEYISRSG